MYNWFPSPFPSCTIVYLYIIGINDSDVLISQTDILARFEELISLGRFYKS